MLAWISDPRLGACLDTCRAIDPSYADAGLAVEVEVVEAVDTLNLNRAAPVAAHLALGMKRPSLQRLMRLAGSASLPAAR